MYTMSKIQAAMPRPKIKSLLQSVLTKNISYNAPTKVSYSFIVEMLWYQYKENMTPVQRKYDTDTDTIYNDYNSTIYNICL